jgi:hypothetical protein
MNLAHKQHVEGRLFVKNSGITVPKSQYTKCGGRDLLEEIVPFDSDVEKALIV